MNRPLQKILRNITSRLASLEQKAESEKSIHENQFEYTEYGLRGDENGKLSIGEIPRKEWVGLTVEDQADILDRKWWDFEDSFDVEGFMRLIESTLRDKNT
jgi:hypothetical protein